MVDRVALGRAGEIFVMRRLMDLGWQFPEKYADLLDALNDFGVPYDKIHKPISVLHQSRQSLKVPANAQKY